MDNSLYVFQLSIFRVCICLRVYMLVVSELCHWDNWHMLTMIYSLDDNSRLPVICCIIKQKSLLDNICVLHESKSTCVQNFLLRTCFDMIILTFPIYVCLFVFRILFLKRSSQRRQRLVSSIIRQNVEHTYKIVRRICNKID